MARIRRWKGDAQGRCKTVEHNGVVWTVATSNKSGNTVAAQTKGTLDILEASLIEAGTDKHYILDGTVYLTDMATKAEMDEVWNAWIPQDGWPCRACVGTALAPGTLVEIKLVAAIP